MPFPRGPKNRSPSDGGSPASSARIFSAASASSAPRPASTGGRAPAPGRNGLRILIVRPVAAGYPKRNGGRGRGTGRRRAPYTKSSAAFAGAPVARETARA